jgi:hypothetical protein
MNNILKIKLKKIIKCSPEINVWNIFDAEHPPFIHGRRKYGDGMDPSFILFELKNINISLDTQKFPFFSFIKRKSIMFHYAADDNSVLQYSSFWGVPIVQRYEAKELENGFTEFEINIAFYLSGFWRLFRYPIKVYVNSWLEKTWLEDLVMKERREKFLNLGFKDLIGMPKKISLRKGKHQDLILPLPKALKEITSHPFYHKNLNKIFK